MVEQEREEAASSTCVLKYFTPDMTVEVFIASTYLSCNHLCLNLSTSQFGSICLSVQKISQYSFIFKFSYLALNAQILECIMTYKEGVFRVRNAHFRSDTLCCLFISNLLFCLFVCLFLNHAERHAFINGGNIWTSFQSQDFLKNFNKNSREEKIVSKNIYLKHLFIYCHV